MILKSDIEKICLSQRAMVVSRDKGTKRSLVLERPGLTSHALIITGIRRCGKSTLMYQHIMDIDSSWFFLNFDDPRLYGFDIGDFQRIRELVEEGEYLNLFFDEIQLIDQWEGFIRQLVDLEKYHIYLSGSNASMLSREMGTHLTGRHISRELFPFSFDEYLDFSGSSPGLESANEYLERGGFPAYLKSGYPEVLSEVLNDIIYRDISIRFGVRNHQALQQLAMYLISNVGKRITANSLLKVMPVASASTMMEYLNYFEKAYLVFFVKKFSYSYRKQIQNPRKVYAIDTGLVFVNSISHSQDRGRRFENMVFLSLRRKYREIFYFSERGECDFVICQKGKPKLLIQACVQLTDDNLGRELEGLYEAMNELGVKKGLLLSMEQEDYFNKGELEVEVLPFHKWKP